MLLPSAVLKKFCGEKKNKFCELPEEKKKKDTEVLKLQPKNLILAF